ncbi:hypothetical protein JHK84_052838 [Glycine max]|nr:hypothetical protein JHK84_052838 [Glycine max]
MVVSGSFPLTSKRRRVTSFCSTDMDAETAKAKLAAVKERFGREIHVFETSVVSLSSKAALSNGEETDDFYEFTAEDYYRLLATKKEGNDDTNHSMSKGAVIRVRFPDNHTLEVTFHPSETIQSLIDLLTKVIAQPEQPFYIYTTPPKKVINDMSRDFYTAGFCPGAIVYFSYNVPKGDSTVGDHTSPYLQEEILSLKDLHDAIDQGQQSEPVVQSEPEPAVATHPHPVEERKPAEKKISASGMAKSGS